MAEMELLLNSHKRNKPSYQETISLVPSLLCFFLIVIRQSKRHCVHKVRINDSNNSLKKKKEKVCQHLREGGIVSAVFLHVQFVTS